METTTKMKSTDPEYFKMYQRELYKTKLCQTINCKTCGATVSVKSLKRQRDSQVSDTRHRPDRDESINQVGVGNPAEKKGVGIARYYRVSF